MGAVEFYFRDEDDPNYQDEVLQTSDEIEMLVYQIKMVLLTNNGEVLGEPRFGASLENLLFDIQFNEESMLAFLKNQLYKFSEIARGYDINMRVKKIRDTEYRDAAIIDVYIDGKNFFGVVL